MLNMQCSCRNNHADDKDADEVLPINLDTTVSTGPLCDKVKAFA
jgi:hypothetical protein